MAQKIGDDGSDVLVKLEAMSVEELNKEIAQSSQTVQEEKERLEADLPNGDKSPYMKAKEAAKEHSSDYRATKKRQNAIIAVCVRLRQEKGAV
ncbi:unnamed protein product [Sphagnum balticum]